MISSSILKNVRKEDKKMAIIINFQEYANSKTRKENNITRKNVSSENGQIINFNKEVIEQCDISDDNKVFNTEQECCEHENQIRQNKENEEKLRAEKQNKLNIINRKYEELQNLLSEFEKDYGVR